MCIFDDLCILIFKAVFSVAGICVIVMITKHQEVRKDERQ